MSEETAKLRLPLIAAAQAQKHVTHNEALTALDTLVQASVLDKDSTTPPGSPAEGDCYIVAGSPTGAWTGWATRIVRFIDGMWRSYIPGAGWLAYVLDETSLYVFNGTAWVLFASAAQPLDADLTAIAGLAPANDDVIQRKAGAWANRTMTALMADLGALGQIPFPATQNPSSDPNTLDDYEEGTFTPVLSTNVTPPSGVTSSLAGGFYTKIGNLVFFSLRYQLTSKGTGATGLAKINGLPFTPAADGGNNSVVATAQFGAVDWPAGYTQVLASINGNDSGLYLQANQDNGAVATLNWSDLTDTSFFRIAGMYRASS